MQQPRLQPEDSADVHKMSWLVDVMLTSSAADLLLLHLQ